MRLRLFERLGRLVSWRFGSQRDRDGRSRDSRATGAEASGRHRRNAVGDQSRDRAVAAVAARGQPPPAQPPPLQPPAGLPRRDTQPPRLAPRTADVRPGGAALPPLPRNYAPGQGGGIGQARIREAPFGAAPLDTATRPQPDADEASAAQARPAQPPRQPWYQVVGGPPAARRLAGQAGQAGQAARAGVAAARNGTAAKKAQAKAATTPANGTRALLPFAAPHPVSYPVTGDGQRNCGPLESVLWRQWDAAKSPPPPQAVAAIDRLAEFPRQLQEKLAAGLDGIYVGIGGVPDLDDMAALHGVPLPSGKATWDACAGAYGDRKIVVGTRPSPTPDVICHEVGHALDDLDSPPGKWQSDSAEFRLIYDQCQPYIASDFHRQRGGLGRKEFFADSFAAIASAQRPALVDMLSGNTRIALRVMLYFN
ncbi:MAG TPA: hypothetical protein VGG54_31850, partial [Trebonia sp.]